MEVFRLSRKQWADQLSGRGAAIRGARWNSIGVEMIYCAGNRSLAMAEVLVHLSLAMLPDDFMMLTILIPDEVSIKKMGANDLPKHWNIFPHSMETQNIGDRFITENEHCVLQVPSVVTKGDFNFLINPHHPDFSKIQIMRKEAFPFDRRLFKTSPEVSMD